jgi:hypothetical protein
MQSVRWVNGIAYKFKKFDWFEVLLWVGIFVFSVILLSLIFIII